eukprot:jgi/Chlat1/1197/Chrsp115S00738
MAFHVKCPFTCQAICYCVPGMPPAARTAAGSALIAEQARKLLALWKQPHLVVQEDPGGGVDVLVPRLAVKKRRNRDAPETRSSRRAAGVSPDSSRPKSQREMVEEVKEKLAAARIAAKQAERKRAMQAETSGREESQPAGSVPVPTVDAGNATEPSQVPRLKIKVRPPEPSLVPVISRESADAATPGSALEADASSPPGRGKQGVQTTQADADSAGEGGEPVSDAENADGLTQDDLAALAKRKKKKHRQRQLRKDEEALQRAVIESAQLASQGPEGPVDPLACEVCHRGTEKEKMVACHTCKARRHMICETPPLRVGYAAKVSVPSACEVPLLQYVCTRQRIHFKASDIAWMFGYTLCDACGRLFKKGNYCPICLKVYRNNEAAPMICCDSCQQWLHLPCAKLTDKQYKKYSDSPELKFQCDVCKGKAPKVPESLELAAEMMMKMDGIPVPKTAAAFPEEDDSQPEAPSTEPLADEKPSAEHEREKPSSPTRPSTAAAEAAVEDTVNAPGEHKRKRKHMKHPAEESTAVIQDVAEAAEVAVGDTTNVPPGEHKRKKKHLKHQAEESTAVKHVGAEAAAAKSGAQGAAAELPVAGGMDGANKETKMETQTPFPKTVKGKRTTNRPASGGNMSVKAEPAGIEPSTAAQASVSEEKVIDIKKEAAAPTEEPVKSKGRRTVSNTRDTPAVVKPKTVTLPSSVVEGEHTPSDTGTPTGSISMKLKFKMPKAAAASAAATATTPRHQARDATTSQEMHATEPRTRQSRAGQVKEEEKEHSPTVKAAGTADKKGKAATARDPGLKQLPTGSSPLKERDFEHEDDMMGRRVAVFWPLDNVHYLGRVTGVNTRRRTVRVVYDDGDHQEVALGGEEQLVWLPDEDSPSAAHLKPAAKGSGGASKQARSARRPRSDAVDAVDEPQLQSPELHRRKRTRP